MAATLAEAVAAARACVDCASMEGRRRVLGPANGPTAARLLIVATAPGRRGAERTGVPLCGDASGTMFDAMLDRAGLTRADVFVTNAVLCNPRDERGRNRQPTRAELGNCRRHLAATLAAVPAPSVIALGRCAFSSIVATAPEQLEFEECFGRLHPWQGRQLGATYHPGPRVANVPSRRHALLQAWDALTSNSCEQPPPRAPSA